MNLRKLIAGGVGLFGLFLAGWGALLAIAQCIYWLKNGQWISVSVLELFVHGWRVEEKNLPILPLDLVPNSLSSSIPWLSTPTSWLGLHRAVTWILGFIPFSLALIIFGAVALGQSVEIEKSTNAPSSDET